MFHAEPTGLDTAFEAGLSPLAADHWQAGRAFVHEQGKGFALPLRVVWDDARGLPAWLAPNSEIRLGRRCDGSSLRVNGREDHHSPRLIARARWSGPGMLRLFLADRPYAAWFFRNPDGSFARTYVNLETPALRGNARIKSTDQILDVVAEPGTAPSTYAMQASCFESAPSI